MSDRALIALQEARVKLQEQQELLDRLVVPALNISRIIEVTQDKRVKLTSGNEFLEVSHPGFDIKPGDEVAVLQQTGQIVRKTNFERTGIITIVRRIVTNRLCEVDSMGQPRLVRTPDVKVEVGDEVLVDSTHSVVLEKIKDAAKQQFEFTGATGVTWDHIGGLDEAKRALQEAVEMPYSFPDLFKWYGKKPVKGVELHGPPGCGKTMLAKALVTSLSQRSGGTVGFFYVKGPEILDQFVGVAESNVRRLFARSRQHKNKTGMPGVLFIDEADAILSKRGTGVSSDMEKTIVPSFLTEMDGLEDFCTIVIIATNRADRLDPAIVRPGRIDRKVHVRRPNENEAANIFELYLNKVPRSNSAPVKPMARHCARGLFSENQTLYRVRYKDGGATNFTLGHLSSGALIANVVDHAVSECLHADVGARRTKTGTGITLDALDNAIRRSAAEVANDNNDDDLKSFVASDRHRVVDIEKVRINS